MLRSLTASEIDDALAGTFPASDPPAWTPGLARPAPVSRTGPAIEGTAHDEQTRDMRGDTADAPRTARSESAFAQAVVSLVAVAGLALLVPFAILAVGAPVALGIRGVLEVTEWFLAIIR